MKWIIPQPIRNAVANSWAHHQTEVMKLSRMAMAKEQGIDEGHVNDFPPSSSQTTVSNHSALATAVTAAAVLGGVGLGATGMRMLLPSAAEPPAVTAPEPATAPPPAMPTEIDSARAKVELYYNDPEAGLIPISGAASRSGAELLPK